MTYPHILTYPYISNVVKFPDVDIAARGCIHIEMIIMIYDIMAGV